MSSRILPELPKRAGISYSQIEEITGQELPPSAYKHRAAWSNSTQNTWPLMAVVRRAGWRVESVQMDLRQVVFTRSK